MADTAITNQLWPPSGEPASTVVVHLTCNSDATGEVAVKKVDIGSVRNYFGVKPTGLRIEQARWCIQGFTSVTLSWDRSAGANTAMILAASGYDDFRGTVGKASGSGGAQDMVKLGGIADPNAGNADGKGSILLTSAGAAAGATYDITLWLRCEANQA